MGKLVHRGPHFTIPEHYLYYTFFLKRVHCNLIYFLICKSLSTVHHLPSQSLKFQIKCIFILHFSLLISLRFIIPLPGKICILWMCKKDKYHYIIYNFMINFHMFCKILLLKWVIVYLYLINVVFLNVFFFQILFASIFDFMEKLNSTELFSC